MAILGKHIGSAGILRWGVALLPTLVGGCGDGIDTGEEPCGGEAEVVIGTGETSWEPLEEGQEVTMIHGPQGGWHVLASARIANTTQEVTLVLDVEHVASGATVASGTWRVALRETATCTGEYPGMYGILDVSDLQEAEMDTPPELLAYETLRLRLTVTDLEGETASDALEVTAVPDPRDLEDTGR